MIDQKKIQSFTDLDTWKQGHKLVLMLYKTTKIFPKEEIFGLTSQMRRCVVSITSNISEGFGRRSYKEKSHFYSIARGSLLEFQNQLFICRDLKYISDDQFNEIYTQSISVHKLVNALLRKTRDLS